MKVIILAAGKGTRMNSDTPKVLLPFAGKTLIEHVLHAVQGAQIDPEPTIIVGHGAESVKAHLKGYQAKFVEQKEQLGTGHAVAVCEPHLDQNEDVIVLYGDHPTIQPETLTKLARILHYSKGPIAMVTYAIPHFEVHQGQFKSYGRILRDEDENLYAIREAKDANEEELDVREVNPGYYAFRGPWLWENIKRLSRANSQKEYYLTDLVELAIRQGEMLETLRGYDLVEAMGVNTPEQLALAERLFRQKVPTMG